MKFRFKQRLAQNTREVRWTFNGHDIRIMSLVEELRKKCPFEIVEHIYSIRGSSEMPMKKVLQEGHLTIDMRFRNALQAERFTKWKPGKEIFAKYNTKET